MFILNYNNKGKFNTIKWINDVIQVIELDKEANARTILGTMLKRDNWEY